jgi:hypothetical protein
MAYTNTDTSTALRTAQLVHSWEPGKVTEWLSQSEVDIWGEKVEVTDLSDYVTKDEYLVAGGSRGDIYRGTYYPNLPKSPFRRMFRAFSQPQPVKLIPVAIKVVRQILSGETQQRDVKIVSVKYITQPVSRVNSIQHLDKEIAIWQRLRHDNILPFLGVSRNFGPLPSPITEWQVNGERLHWVILNPRLFF